MNDRPTGQSAAVARCAVCAAYEAHGVRAAERHRGDVLALDLRDASRRCSPHSDPRRLPAELASAIGPGGLLHLTVRTDDLTPELWEDLLVEAGFTVDEMTTGDTVNTADATADADMLAAGRSGGHRLIRARRRDRPPYPRVAGSPRVGARPPTAHAMIGVGVIVRDGAGRILLGLHRGGTWELPGGALEPGESVAAAAVRELREETGLRAHEHDVTVFAMLLDTAVGAPRTDRPDKDGDADGTDTALARVTMAAVVTVYDGAVLAAEPELIRHWRWTRADELPSPLFTPSAQVLAAWRPELDIEHGPVHRLDVMDRTAPGTGPGFGTGPGLGPGSGTGSGPAPGAPVQGFRATPA
ncbi:nucleotide triphosphate diphosphatase NUDT15 [Streptomyces hebeiensis]